MKKLILLFLTASVFAQDIELKGVVSADNNQIKNIANPTDDQDAVTKAYLIEKTNELLSQIEALQSHTGYPNALIDQDGNPYEFKTYGTQIWTLSNAEVVTYSDGTPIPQVTDATEWANLITGAWCYYDNDPTKGKLYNWYAVAGIHDTDPNTPNKEFAPTGWHIPTNSDWTELENYLIANGYNYDGTTTGNKIAKAMASIDGWQNSDGDGTPGNSETNNNTSQFTALPVGERRDDSGSFVYQGVGACFWSSEVISTFEADRRCIYYHIADVRGGVMNKQNGYSIRFVKNEMVSNNTDHIPDHLEVGDLWGGGIVVNIDPTRQNATIMATKEYLSPPIAFDSKAYVFSYTSPGYTDGLSQDHYGADNTLELIKIKNDPNIDSLNEAANYCDQIVIDGYDDWYLPTFQELLYAHSNLFLEHIYFSGIELWSSIYIGDDAYKLKLSYGGANQASNERVEKNLHLGQVRALPFRTVGTIY